MRPGIDRGDAVLGGARNSARPACRSLGLQPAVLTALAQARGCRLGTEFRMALRRRYGCGSILALELKVGGEHVVEDIGDSG